MAAIDDLIDQIENKALRDRIKSETNKLTEVKKFGMTFEQHMPEKTPIFSAKIRVGSKVILKSEIKSFSNIWNVVSIEEGMATCINKVTHIKKEFPTSELVMITEFGEVTFPALIPVGQVETEKEAPWHSLIEADNFHALQLLEYIYSKKIDCIYIDPPYNTGARDWKYNNDYVETKDRWRHSKWLAFMERRLKIAKRLLKEDGVLITAIDDNEYAHLWMLLHDIFPSYEHIPVTIQHNPGGTQGEKFSVTHEYAIFSLSKNAKVYKKPHLGGETYNLRRWGSTSGRFEGATCFYPIILDEARNIIGFGDIPKDDFHPSSQTIEKEDGTFEVWPIDGQGIEKKWRYARNTVESVKSRMFVVQTSGRTEIKLRREEEQPKTVWTNKLYNAEAHGTTLINKIVGNPFSYPKSIYTVKDAITSAVSGKKDALILDFFAGSGTTLNAVNLLNAIDGGKRRCILVTNNEVSEAEAKNLSKEGLFPGDLEWEKKGICQSITWPRSKYTILGKRDDGTQLEGEYFTGAFITKEKSRRFYQISFTDAEKLNNNLTKKKELVALLGKEKLAISKVEKDVPYVISDKHPGSILFDDSMSEEWIEKLDGHENITDFYIVSDTKKIFNEIKASIESILGNNLVLEEEMLPLSKGFEANIEYFKLDFLDKDEVTLGDQFREILPILWLQSGSKGPCPRILPSEELPGILIPDYSSFAVLIDENQFAKFAEQIKEKHEISYIYLVTDSEEAFQEMTLQLPEANIIQLYTDYLENFSINKRGE